ncbi:MAG: response regulator [Janthinobacterium lividum]
MKRTLRLLLLEDSPMDAELTLARLEFGGYACETTIVDSEAAFAQAITREDLDIVLADFVLPGFSGTEALAMARAAMPDLPFVFVSGVLGEEHAVEMLKMGATDYVLKQRLQRLPAVVSRALAEREERRQRILAERTLRETESHFRLVVDALKDYAVVTLDPAGMIRTWNAASERILGYAAQDVVGRSARVFLNREERAAGVFERELEMARTSGSCSDDRWLLARGGEPFFAAAVTTAIRDEHGALLGFSKIIRDATEARIAADALRMAKEQAETANRAKDHFLAVLSHELRTPLTPILAAARLIELKTRLSPELASNLDVIRRNVELEARLIDDLLDLTSIARGKLSLRLQPVDLTALLASALDMSASDMHAKQLKLITHYRAASTVVSGDAARLQQIIWNVIKNAVKFTPAGGEIVVTTRNPRADQVCVSIEDSGIGISVEALPRIFSAFEQADDSITRAFGGLGLGLAIANTLAQKHGGTLSASSRGRDQGARFDLTLPLLSTQIADLGTGTHAAPRVRSGTPLRVMLVEDNHYTSTALAELLDLSGHAVRVAATVAEAEKLARAESFDVLISDIGLPDGSGLDVVKAWRALQPQAPAFAITGYGMDDDIRRCEAAGFADHLTKPLDFDRLEQLLADVALRKTGA